VVAAAEVDVGPAGGVEDEFGVVVGVVAAEGAVGGTVAEESFERFGVLEAGEDVAAVLVAVVFVVSGEVEHGGGTVVEAGEKWEVTVGEVVEGVEEQFEALPGGAVGDERFEGVAAELVGGAGGGGDQKAVGGVALAVEGDAVDAGGAGDVLGREAVPAVFGECGLDGGGEVVVDVGAGHARQLTITSRSCNMRVASAGLVWHTRAHAQHT
jgi:hypothetical protein